MSLSTRYSLLGMVVGLLAPAGLFLVAVGAGKTLDPALSAVVLAVGGMIVFAVVGRMIGRRDEDLLERNRELAVLSEKLREQSTTDALTGLYNRRSFDDRLAMELTRTQRYGAPCALVMIDLDRFKSANDRYGHQAGDEVLRHVAAVIDAEKRAGDMIARYGGEELVAILPHTEAADAQVWAERVRARIEAEPTRWHDTTLRITASFGVAAAPPHETSASVLIEAADRALYVAKQRGRNTVVANEGARLADRGRGGDAPVAARVRP